MQPVGSAAKARYYLCYLWYLCDRGSLELRVESLESVES